MGTSKTKHVLKTRQRNTVVKEDISEDQVVSVEEEKEVSWTEFEQDLVGPRSLSEVTKPSFQGPKTTKDTNTQKKVTGKGKGSDLAPTRGVGS